MSGGNARHGRRDNGLYAAAYAAVGDVDPRIGEHLLDVLGNRGIAAYLQPTADQHPITRLTTLPARPTDRLYVDRSELDSARKFLETLTKGADAAPDAGTASNQTQSSTEFDEAWASIVAGFDQTTDSDVTPWPAIEDIAGRSAATSAPSTEREYPRLTRSGPRDDDFSLLDGLDRFGEGLPDDDEDDDYHPPTPPPLPRLATITIVAIIGIVAGMAIIVDPDLLPIDSNAAFMLGCLCVVAGAAVLIGRLRSGNDDDSEDPDHGAVV